MNFNHFAFKQIYHPGEAHLNLWALGVHFRSNRRPIHPTDSTGTSIKGMEYLFYIPHRYSMHSVAVTVLIYVNM